HGQAISRAGVYKIERDSYDRTPDKNLPFCRENKSQLVGKVTRSFGEGFGVGFLILRYVILKK
uniref:Uncharacterized protein n=1 Tax=Xenopus tropicalis TaxID=8364 RepID=A0A803JVG3_XENTR